MLFSKKDRNFKESTRHLFLQYTFTPFIILLVLFFIFTIYNTRSILSTKTNEASHKISQNISNVYNSYYEEINRMASSLQVIKFVSTHQESQNIYEEFYEFNNRQNVKSIFHITDTKGVFLSSSAPTDHLTDDVNFHTMITRIAKDPAGTLTEMNNFRYSHDRYTVYTFGKAIVQDNIVTGYLIYQLYEADLQKLIFEPNNEISVITDQHHTIIATTNNITRGLLNKFKPTYDSKGYVELQNGKYYISEKELPAAQMQVYTLNSIKSEETTYYTLSIFIIVVSLSLWILIYFLARKMSIRNTQSIDKLLYAVNQLREGTMDSYVDIRTGDEFESLGNQYNTMLDRLNDLLSKNNELTNIRIATEIKQLQSQFHPHFIFNVLETLRYAIKVDANQAQEIVMILSRLLRYSVSNDGQTVLLKDDLNYVQDYLKLQQIRFNERLQYTVDVSSSAGNPIVPKLLLQAIIENSIKYGYKNQNYLKLSISVYTNGQDLILEVRDNGTGMSEERLAQVKSIMNHHDNTSEHIGLYNVHRRLVLLYGESYGIQIDSTQGKGACVRLTIPHVKGDDDV